MGGGGGGGGGVRWSEIAWEWWGVGGVEWHLASTSEEVPCPGEGNFPLRIIASRRPGLDPSCCAVCRVGSGRVGSGRIRSIRIGSDRMRWDGMSWDRMRSGELGWGGGGVE